MKQTIFALLLSLSLLFTPHARAQDIVDTAVAADDFTILVAALEATGLDEALRGDGPFTVFAPTDAAFSALGQETIDALLADTVTLSSILLFHVAAGSYDAEAVLGRDGIQTLNGAVAAVDADAVQIEGANIVATNIETDNGIIHVIDAVILPPENDIVDTAVGAGLFNTLVAAVQAAGLEDTLRSAGPFTVFAPTDDAFAALGEDTINALLADPDALANILLYHVVPGALTANDVLSNDSLTTAQGDTASISLNDTGAFINDAQIIMTNIFTSNGVIHVIDAVILPPTPPAEATGIEYEVTIVNLTKGQVFSPPILVSHNSDAALFQLGQPASGALALLAEDGDASELATALRGLDAVNDVKVSGAPMMPGETRVMSLKLTPGKNLVSVAGMLVQTNDAFFAATAEMRDFFLLKRSIERQPVNAMANAYDAGSEFNSESCAHIPGPPCGSPLSSPDEDGEGYVYISNGIHGVGDLDSATYDWRGPVAKITVIRK